MDAQIISRFIFGDTSVVYYKKDDVVSLLLVPNDRYDDIKQSKLNLGDHMLQLFITGDDFPAAYSQGVSMRNSPSLFNYKFVGQKDVETEDGHEIITTFKKEGGNVVTHYLKWSGRDYFRSRVEYSNQTNDEIEIQLLSSFSLASITPFVDGEAPNSLILHRMRSYWSEEGRLESIPFEDLNLDSSWSHHNVKCERFGQLGTMPVRKFFPFAAIQDTAANVTWAVQLAWAGSWQIEIYRKGFAVAMSGGLADFEFGHFKKILKPGESLTTPEAYLTTVVGDVDAACARLIEAQEENLSVPDIEQELPVMYNEYCDTWGKPTEETINKQLETAKALGLKYFVIDAGWYDHNEWSNSIGDWKVSKVNFPSGIKSVVSRIKKAGMIPGIWFEFENVGIKSEAFAKYKDHLLKRDGHIILSGSRAFWDMCDPWVQDYLYDRVIGFLKENDFGYIKVDYNETYGIGCDGAESYGEALRQRVLATQKFFRKIKEEIPGIIIENCASGGHRLEPSMMALSSMASFSDAHECNSIPIIAANLHRAILPRQSQIWAVLHPEDSNRRLVYSLTNTFLGRMCLSGNIYKLSEEQLDIVTEAICFYRSVSHIIKQGRSYLYGPKVRNYNVPEGWQCLVRFADDKKEALVVFHSFGGSLPQTVEITRDEFKNMKITSCFGEAGIWPSLQLDKLVLPVAGNFSGMAVLLKAY